jgi:predicted dehydrogenase
MATNKIRLGVIGASARRGWARKSHLPAIGASPDVELTAVCTTRLETAEEAAQKFGAQMAFADHHEMLACPDIDAVVVVLRVPRHYQVTLDALNAGKHVFTEWPLGRTTDEAKELANVAGSKGLLTMVGLQSRGDPAILRAKELIESGYVGDVMACHVSVARGGALRRDSDVTWRRDNSLGATTLTIAGGHTIDALQFVVGDLSRLSAIVSTQAPQWFETDTERLVDVTAPDHILVNGRLRAGGVASVHVASVPWAGSGYRMEIYGREGTLVASSGNTPQFGLISLRGASGVDKELTDLEVPAEHCWVPEGMPKGDPYNVGQLYHRFADVIRSGVRAAPDFNTAVELHELLDTVVASSKQGSELAVTGGR